MKHLNLIKLNGRTEICATTLMFCEGDSNYTTLHFADSKPVTVPKTLKKVILDIADMSFFRIHKKYLINLRYLKKRDGEYITLANDTYFVIARRRQAALNKAIKNNLFNN